MPLCEDCQHFDLQSFRQDPYLQRGYAYQDVSERATYCDFCEALSSSFETGLDARWIHFELLDAQKNALRSDREQLAVLYVRAFLGERRHIRLGPSYPKCSPKYPRGQTVLFRACADEGSPAATSGDVLGRYCNRSLSAVTRAIGKWLASCLRHETCRRMPFAHRDLDPYAAPLPSRCLNVGTLAKPQLHLEETASCQGAFITLTHRWNRLTNACSTTAVNYPSRLSSINVGSLPRVFQEAVQVTRHLKVKYLWIDSLCIIQQGDDNKDWNFEANRMVDYYQSALLTLCALNSERLLPGLNSFRKSLIQLPYRSPGSENLEGYFYVFRLDALNHTYQRLVQDSELLTRAWVFQEFLLSRRIIHFTSSTIIYECQSSNPESDLGETIAELRPDGSREVVALVNKRHFRLDEESTSISRWYEIAEAYSGLRFSYPEKDRLVALSGLATEFGKAMIANPPPKEVMMIGIKGNESQETRYIEGVWLDHAHVGLLWEKAGIEAFTHLPGRPSWSWTSMYAQVLWYPSTPHGVDCNPSYASLTAYQTATDVGSPSTITLRSKLQPVLIDRLLKTWEIKHLFESKMQPRAINDFYRAVRNTCKDRKLCGWASIDMDEPRLSCNMANAEGLFDDRQQTLSSMPNVADKGREIFALHISTLRGLSRAVLFGYHSIQANAYYVLFVRNLHDNVFERIGMGCLFGLEVDRAIKEAEFQEVALE